MGNRRRFFKLDFFLRPKNYQDIEFFLWVLYEKITRFPKESGYLVRVLRFELRAS